jgi:signal transduction histidine kinase
MLGIFALLAIIIGALFVFYIKPKLKRAVVSESKQVERGLRRLNVELEQRVKKRTAELADANELLKQEIIVRRRAEEQAQLMALFAELNPTPVMRFDSSGKITMTNPAASDVFGRPSVEGVQLDEVLPELADIDFQACISGSEKHAITSTHHERTYSFFVCGVAELGFGQAYATDVTELAMARVQAEAANRAKSQFLTNMSHELRTPLTVINGFSEVLLEMDQGNFSEQQCVYLDRIKKNGEHLLVLINDLLDLAKIEAGRVELEFSSADLGSILREAGELMLANVNRRGLVLHQALPEHPVTVNGDPLRLKQVALNLISNAIKFTREGSVTLWLDEHDSQVEFGIKDTGIGIAAEHQNRLFKPFEQVHDKLKVAEQGTGLGLALCYEIVTAHGGTIRVESEKNIGSNFIIILPKEAQKP